MKILVTGGSGQLGQDVIIELSRRGHQVLSPTHHNLDITNQFAVTNYFCINNPEAVIHCAAYTAVDKAETEITKCRKTNVYGTENITKQCIKKNIPELFVSTDYVFNGKGHEHWDISDPVDPINVYGKSKADAEIIVRNNPKHYIIRTSWLFGNTGKNFINTMLKLYNNNETIRVVSDQIGSPTYTCDLAPLLCDVIETNSYGTYHAHNEGFCSWFDFAKEFFNSANIDIKISPITTKDYPTTAKRPLNSTLLTSSLTNAGFKLLPHWTDAVKRYTE
jgi:dTDP-4-dehydrorhamnose reductase